jgi:hypothetical protein
MPRDITVTFDDGSTHVYRGAPDNITPEQVSERAAKEFGRQVTALDGGKKSGGSMAVDAAGAILRGAGSIGATLLAPIDAAARALNGGKPVNVGGYDIVGQDRRAAMDQALDSAGVNRDSLTFKAGKLGTEIAGTAGAGGVAGNALARLAPMAGSVAPAVNAIASATKTAGFTGANMAARTAGGAINGLVSAGMVNPDDALTGAVVGGALPGVARVAGMAGNAVGRAISGPEQSQALANAVQAARDSGYVIPPSQANPTLLNRTIEGFSGKITTAQNASARNQAITNAKAAAALGLPADAQLTPDILKGVRDQAGQAYQALGATGTVTPGAAYVQKLDDIAAPFVKAAQAFPNAKPSPVLDLVESLKSPAFDAAAAVEKVKQLRTAADDAFRSGNTDVARASRSAAGALEDALETHLQTIGNPQLLQQFKDARQLIAKTYTVEKALNPASGGVDARKLAGQLAKGKPLSGDLKQAAEFAAQFPKAAQTIEGMGSLPQMSPLDFGLAGIMGTASANPLALASVAARPAARALALSPLVQNRLVQSQGPNAIAALLANQQAGQLAYRAAPLAVTDR